MERVDNKTTKNSFYLPRSCVIDKNSFSTKLRIVFEASWKSSNNFSLDDNLLTDPILQPDLFTILIQFRIHQYVATAYISKMYRCVWIHPDNRNYQKNSWRKSPE